VRLADAVSFVTSEVSVRVLDADTVNVELTVLDGAEVPLLVMLEEMLRGTVNDCEKLLVKERVKSDSVHIASAKRE